MTVEDGSNNRIAPRLRTLKGARLVFVNNMSTFECKVRNLSATGACVELSSTLGIPNHIKLKMDDGSPERDCDVMWRTDTRLGLRFRA